ncbi:3'-5' exonuclease [Flaviflexus massiliensis]|uniref:3'-5' exonuclease n=1 Tax=Flaviflexus massiliensis TaxID=1522309 RepID=UPI00164CE796|nr:3'-5' exonuclease [Flaviflexus massiliensis]
MEFAVIDVETTGLDATVDRIVDLAVLVTNDQAAVKDRWSSLVNPERAIGATHIHGLTDNDVTDAPVFSDLVPHLIRLIRGRIIVAHNVAFDLSFLNAEFERAGFSYVLPREVGVCTMEQSYLYLPEGRHNLAACLERAGIDRTDTISHRAASDTESARALLAYYIRAEKEGRKVLDSAINRHSGGEITPREWERATPVNPATNPA